LINSDSEESDLSEKEILTDLIQRAYKMLARREYSVQEIRNKFRSENDTEIIDAVIEYLIENNSQSDQRYAEMLCRSRFNAGKGPLKLLHELRNQNIDEEIIELTMSDYSGKWKNLADEVRVRKFGEELPDNFSEWSRQARFLQQRGFSSEQINQFKN
jgi:regulatory protein